MKLLFSEHIANYAHYIFPYAIWAVPEPGETPAMLFDAGFLPSSRQLDRFYMCRHLRVALAAFAPSSENRRIMRKCKNISCTLVPRADFDFTDERRRFYKNYADIKFGHGVMSDDRLDSLFSSPLVSSVLVFTDDSTGAEVGAATIFAEPPHMAYYYYAFYDLNYYRQNLGMYMMTAAVNLFAERGFTFLYLGSCYSKNALYKTQFSGVQFFNGVQWCGDLVELKLLLARQDASPTTHLLESEDFCRKFYPGGVAEMAAQSAFTVRLIA